MRVVRGFRAAARDLLEARSRERGERGGADKAPEGPRARSRPRRLEALFTGAEPVGLDLTAAAVAGRDDTAVARKSTRALAEELLKAIG